MGGPVPEEILSRPVSLRSGIGVMHQKVSTSSSEAQAFYDQGLAYLHSYVWLEAARSFHQALRSDPNLAMAYVELADAYIGLQDIPSARAACAKARALQAHMNDNERAWLAIREDEVGFLASPSQETYSAYQQAITDAIDKNQNDPWLWVQRGLSVEGSPATHGQAGGSESLPYYQTALKLDPKNLAALHYKTHCYENLGMTQEALDGSAVYVRLAPAIPHAHHMHGHELVRLGRTEEALQEFLKTDELEDTYYRTEKIPAQYDWHHAHNLQFIGLSYELLGQNKAAARYLRQAFDLPAYTGFLAYNRRVWPEFLINRSRFEEALAASQEMTRSPWPMARLAGHTLSGEALLGLNRLDEARQQLDLADKETAQVSDRVLAALPYPAALRGAILLREARVPEGEGIIVKVIQTTLSMPGPDAWLGSLFVVETIARDAREAGDWPLAQYAAEQMIQHNPYYAGGHFAIGLVAEHAGENEGARTMFAEAAKLWAHGDQNLPELVLTRAKLAAH